MRTDFFPHLGNVVSKKDKSSTVKFIGVFSAAALVFSLAGCATITGKSQTEKIKDVYVATHGSFSLPEELLRKFTKDTGYVLHFEEKGAGGELVNQLVLTKDNPVADAVFGIDNTFGQRALDQKILQDAKLEKLDESIGKISPNPAQLVPVDQGDVCVNIDKIWFPGKGLNPPSNLDDLTNWRYEDLVTIPNPTSSSPGMAFMLATIAKYGEDGWINYWKQLKKNKVKLVAGWSEAYNQEFTAGEGKGQYPIVLSYSSSPAATFDKSTGQSSTASLSNTCFRQVEYAGVLAKAKNPDGARAFVKWLLSNEVQKEIPTSMWVYPVLPSAQEAASAAHFEPLSDNPLWIDPATIGAKREEWLNRFSQEILG